MSEGDYGELFFENPQPMLLCHRETRKILEVNEAALRLYGYQRHELLQLSLAGLMGEEDLIKETFQDLGRSRCHRRKDGSCVEVGLICHLCQFAGEPAYLLLPQVEAGHGASAREMELERKVTELSCELATAKTEMETFSYSISHDLQAPLRHLNGFSQALLDDYEQTLDPQAKEYLSRISQAAGKMSQLIEAIQQLARVARGEVSLQQVSMSVSAQVIALELKHAAPKRQVEFVIEQDVNAIADPGLARQLMEILIGNAWKFSLRKERACIEFGSRKEKGETIYFVKDNGAGFDLCYADKLFSIFNRLHRADEFEGTGVGLAIAHRIVCRHGGRIWAESIPEHGATFYFTL